MKVTNLSVLAPGAESRHPGSGRRVAIGTFDGLHVGHREVIRGNDTVLTFDPHPMSVIRPEATPKLVMPFAIKRDLIAGLGVEELVVISFDTSFAALSAEHFIADVLLDRLGATAISVGENFRFGHGAGGTPESLSARSEFATRVVALVEVAGEAVSSSQIRGLVAAGEVDKAATFLGAPFMLEGEVVHGDRRGRELGMPTANVVPEDRLVAPGHGVYAGWAHVKPLPAQPAEPAASDPLPAQPAEPAASGFPAAINVGVRPTFETGRGLLVEPHLIGFDGDLYGQTLRIAFLERMRGERRFESAEALMEQMSEDVAQAQAICERSRQPPPSDRRSPRSCC